MGMRQHGEKNPHSKLNRAKVLAIRLDPRTAPEVAADYRIGASTVRAIRRGTSWPQVPMPKNMPSWPKGKAGQKAYRQSKERRP